MTAPEDGRQPVTTARDPRDEARAERRAEDGRHATSSGWPASGWLEAGLFVLAISTLNVVYAIANHFGADVTAFILYATAFAAIGMLCVTGLGDDWRAVLAARQSWLFGAATVAMEGFYYLLVAATTPAEGALLLRLSVPASILVGGLLFSRTVTPMMLIGCGVILAGVVPVYFGVPADALTAAIALSVACALIVATKTFASEFHPWNRAAKSIRERLRVTGLVVLATGVLGSLVLALAVALNEAGMLPATGLVPPLSAFIDPTTIAFAVLLGAPVIFAVNYLTFAAVVKIGTESFLATSAFTPFTTLALQLAAVAAGLMVAPAFEWWLVPLVVIGIVGVMIVIRARHRHG